MKRVIGFPKRIEEGIAPDTVAMMQSAGTEKHPYEIWVMIQETQTNTDSPSQILFQNLGGQAQTNAEKRISQRKSVLSPRKSAFIEVISVWRYPGKTKPGQPLPEEIMKEIRNSI